MKYFQSAGSLQAIRRAIVLLGVAVVAFIWFLHHKQFAVSEASALEAKAAAHLSLASVVAESLKQITDRGQPLAALIVHQLELSPQVSQQTLQALADDQVFSRVAIYESSGAMVTSSDPSMPLSLPERWTKELQDHAASFSSTPFLPSLLPSTHKRPGAPAWRLPVLLSVTSGISNQATHVVLIEIDVGYLTSIFRNMDLGLTGTVHLFDASGEEILRADSSGVIVGGEPLRLELGKETGQAFLTWQGSRYQTVYRQLHERGFGIAVSQQYQEIAAPVRSTRAFQGWLNLAMTFLIGLALIWLVRMLGHQTSILSALQRSEARNHSLIVTLREEHESTRRAASIDHLSGLYNRREFLEVAELRLHQQRNARKLLAILFLDLDRFKTINDTLGHKVGDMLLQAVAGRIQRTLQPGDVAARFGGDEFVVLLEAHRSEQDIADYAHFLVERIPATYSLEAGELTTSPSIGVAICPRDAQDVDMLIRHADAAMYCAKQAGRGQYRFYDSSLNRVSIEEFQLEQAFSEALRKHQFVLHYQPQIALDSMKVIGYEALVRWEHPEFGLIYPDRFISLAERSGFIAPLGNEVLRLACTQLAKWRAEGRSVFLGINVSPLQLNQPGFSDSVLSLAAELALDPKWIDLEITETAILNQDGIAIAQLERLRSTGVKISLDDFGCGYAGFAHLQSLPISKLKLDRSLIARLSNSPDDSPIISSTISLAKRLGLQVVGEGVETTDQLVCLKLAGCDIAQGYHFSRPLPAAELVAQNTDQVLAQV